MAFTSKAEFDVKEVLPDGRVIIVYRGKRKKMVLDTDRVFDKSHALFRGHDLPLKADSETRNFVGNALINCVIPSNTDEEKSKLRAFIEKENINVHTDLSIFTVRTEEAGAGYEEPLYMDKAVEAAPDHACIRTMLKRCENVRNQGDKGIQGMGNGTNPPGL
jgi:hypothetical protein